MILPCKDSDNKYGCVYWDWYNGECTLDDECPYDNITEEKETRNDTATE